MFACAHPAIDAGVRAPLGRRAMELYELCWTLAVIDRAKGRRNFRLAVV